MQTPAELHDLCQAVRRKQRAVDEEMVALIEFEVAAYLTFLTDEDPPKEPPAELVDRLPLLGWLIYETSLVAVQRVATAFELQPSDKRFVSEEAFGQVERIADAGRQLPWAEFAPRWLGAIRAQALAESKRDTLPGYNQAWTRHRDARQRSDLYAEIHHGRKDRVMLREVDEVLLQLALSETGTACRTAEQVIGQWSEGVADASWREDDNFDLIRRMFRELHEGVTVGREALARAEEIEREYGLVKSVRADRMAMATALQNPGIMTARAALLMLSLCGEMESFDLPPLGGAANWAEQREQLVRQFEEAYRAIGREVRLEDDTTTQPNLNEAHQRSIVQLRLHLGLLKPGHHLQATSQFDPFRDHPVVDGASIEALSAWLAQPADNGEGIRGDANVIGSATMHNFIRSVEACPESFGLGPSSYAQWRRRWFVLDRYAGNESRRATVEGIFGSLESPSRSRSKRVGWLSRLFGRR